MVDNVTLKNATVELCKDHCFERWPTDACVAFHYEVATSTCAFFADVDLVGCQMDAGNDVYIFGLRYGTPYFDAPAGWGGFEGYHCSQDQGGTLLGDGYLEKATSASCLASCRATEGCVGVTLDAYPTEPQRCWLWEDLDLSACKLSDRWLYDTYVMPGHFEPKRGWKYIRPSSDDYGSVNCWQGHGGLPFSSDDVPSAPVTEEICRTQCEQQEGCVGYAFEAESQSCWPRQALNGNECDEVLPDSPKYMTASLQVLLPWQPSDPIGGGTSVTHASHRRGGSRRRLGPPMPAPLPAKWVKHQGVNCYADHGATDVGGHYQESCRWYCSNHHHGGHGFIVGDASGGCWCHTGWLNVMACDVGTEYSLYIPETRTEESALIHAVGWNDYIGFNCYAGHGGEPFDDQDFPLALSMDQCFSACRGKSGCVGITVPLDPNGEQCWLRKAVDPSKCDKHGPLSSKLPYATYLISGHKEEEETWISLNVRCKVGVILPFDEKDSPVFLNAISSRESCQAACLDEPACVAVSVHYLDGDVNNYTQMECYFRRAVVGWRQRDVCAFDPDRKWELSVLTSYDEWESNKPNDLLGLVLI